MQFLLIVALLIAFAVPDAGNEPVTSVAGRLMAVGLSLAAVLVVASACARRVEAQLRRNFLRRDSILRQFEWMRRVHGGLLLGAFAAVTHALGWNRLVRINWGLEGTVLADELLLLAPFLVPLVLSWAIFYRVDRAARTLANRGTGEPVQVRTRWQYVGFHLRHNLALLLVPILILFAGQDLIRLLGPARGRPDGWQQVALVVLIGLVVVAFPVLLRMVWQASPLPTGSLRSRLEAAGRRQRFRVRDILLWNTQGSMVNAAVVGFLPRLRYVLLSDGLIENLDGSEIEAVFGHEAGHIVHRHLLSRILCLAAVASLVMLGSDFAAYWVGDLPGPLESLDLSDAVIAGFGLVAMAGMTFWGVFGYCSRQLERQADVYSCRSNSCGRPDCSGHDASDPTQADHRPLPQVICPTSVATFITSLERLAMLNGMSRSAPSWQHSSIARRVAFLERIQVDPRIEWRFQRRVRCLNWAMALVVCGTVAYYFVL